MTKKYLILFCFQFLAISLIAQLPEEQKRNYFIGAYYSMAFPQGILKENIGNLDNQGTIDLPRNAGFAVNGLFQSKRDPWLFMGFDYSLYFLDFEFDDFVDYNLQTSNYYTTVHYRIQAQYEFDPLVKPYVEGLLGTQYFFTRTVRQDFIDEGAYRGSEFETGDWGVSFGGGVGVQVEIAKQFFINASLSYLRGMPTEYLVRTDNPPIGGIPLEVFEPITTPTDVVTFKVGFQFGRNNPK